MGDFTVLQDPFRALNLPDGQQEDIQPTKHVLLIPQNSLVRELAQTGKTPKKKASQTKSVHESTVPLVMLLTLCHMHSTSELPTCRQALYRY